MTDAQTMCGRYSQTGHVSVVDLLGGNLDPASVDILESTPVGNLAPTQMGPVILVQDGQQVARRMRWGLVPRFSREIGTYATFNARSETVASSPAFRSSFKDRRCLVPCEGFYEWRALPGQEHLKRPRKRPYKFTMADGAPFMMAGLWDSARIDGVELQSYTIVTTTPNDLVADYHHRMAVILHPCDYAEWLDPENRDVESLKRLLVPFPAELMKAEPAYL